MKLLSPIVVTITKTAPEMATNGAPDNWDDGMDVSNKMEALNVNAPSFVPNVNAPTFVPSWGAPPPPVVTTPDTAPEDQMQVDQGAAAPEPAPAPVTGNGPGRPAPAPADSWEDKADLSSTATTPEDEDMSMEDDTGELRTSKQLKCVQFVSGSVNHFAVPIYTNYNILIC